MENSLNTAVDVLQKVTLECRSKHLLLSGGLDSTILAYFLKDRGVSAISIISKDFVANDLTYCQLVSQRFNMPLQIKMCETTEIYNGIEETIRILKNFNDIEIRNNVIVYLAMSELKGQGVASVITGDGADEIFAGYNFLLSKNSEDLEQDLKRIEKIMHFPSRQIGQSLGVTVEMPFCNKEVVDFAKSLPVDMLVRDEDGKRFGKWILRKAFEDKIPKQIVWRTKSPMQDGAGTQGLTEFFSATIPDSLFDERAKRIKEEDGITIRTKESLQYYEIYRKHYKVPAAGPEKPSCPDCLAAIDENSKFCRMCGKFPI
ncbi:MAG TPA: asparagine synthase C-terminal domain-containing protein [Candidatus Nitrosotenuis sp.]|nr:asparagine synthase C-terminal domain-containing protein [Candidatus Nitrosotenuis sp.]